MFVVDASIVLAWLLPAEKESEIAETIMLEAKLAGPVAPAIFPLEVANALRSKLRRGDIDVAYREQALNLLDRLGVARDMGSFEPDVLRETVRLSDAHGLTVYDASYLEAAIRHQAPLASLDQDLRRAAMAEGVDVHPT